MQARARAFWGLYVSVLIATIGYGISFPLLSIRLEQTGVSGGLIGLNSAMPALGWLIGAVFLPALHRALGLHQLLLACLAIAVAAMLSFMFSEAYWAWTGLRFLFGGAIGLFFRCIEYWITGVSGDQVRGRNIGLYSVCFMIGIALGSAIQPELGATDLLPFVVIAGLLVLSGTVVTISRLEHADFATAATIPALTLVPLLAVPIAGIGALTYGLIEDIPAYLLSVYALRNGLGTDVAAYTLTAVAVGNILMPVPVGMLSDKIGRVPVVLGFAALAAILSAAIPQTLSSPALFLGVLIIWGGSIGAIYCVSLAMIGDQFQGSALVVANAGFGIVYAVGSLAGPLINGAALDTLNSHGLMLSAATILCAFIVLGFASSMRTARGRVQ